MRLSLTSRLFMGALLLVALLAACLSATGSRASAAGSGPVTDPPQAPELEGGVRWINSKPLKLTGLRGKVVLIDFWEYTCVNCLRTLPYLKEWHRRYKDKGLVIIGVHTPEFRFARAEDNVAAAVKELGLEYPIVIDSNYAIWKSYSNRFWPAKYLCDARGRVRYYHFGEGGYGETEREIQALLRETSPKVDLPPLMEAVRAEDQPGRVCYPTTPELYVGYERGGPEGTFGNREGYHPGQVFVFRDPGSHEDGLIYAQGAWKSSGEAFISARTSRYPRDWIALRYHAIEANAVMKPERGSPVRLWLYQDGKPVAEKCRGKDVQADDQGRTFVLVDKPRMYNLIKNPAFGQHELRLATSQPGLGVYSFTFVSCEIARAP
jgi:thiol-disulfide isomerase/thioredoxin